MAGLLNHYWYWKVVGKMVRAIAITSILSKPIPGKGGESMWLLTKLSFMAVYSFSWHIWKHNHSVMQQTIYTLAKLWTDSNMCCCVLCAFHPYYGNYETDAKCCIKTIGNSGARGIVRTNYTWQRVFKGSSEFRIKFKKRWNWVGFRRSLAYKRGNTEAKELGY